MTADTPRALAAALASPLATGDHVRPLLDMVIQVSGLECAYLTRVDRAEDRQWVLVSQHRARDGLVIPEGASAAWSDSLCRRALEQGVAYTTDVERLRAPDTAGCAADIRTFASQPVAGHDGALLGTLCAVSAASVPLRATVVETLALFARLLAMQVEHDRVAAAARAAFEDRATGAIAGALDGASNGGDRETLRARLHEVFRLHPWDRAGPLAAGA